jgi:hypothetical protein
MTQPRSRSAPIAMPGKRPAKKTPGGKGFFLSPCCSESMIVDPGDDTAAGVAVAVDWEIVATLVEEGVDAALEDPFESLRELLATIIAQYVSAPPDGVMQS